MFISQRQAGMIADAKVRSVLRQGVESGDLTAYRTEQVAMSDVLDALNQESNKGETK